MTAACQSSERQLYSLMQQADVMQVTSPLASLAEQGVAKQDYGDMQVFGSSRHHTKNTRKFCFLPTIAINTHVPLATVDTSLYHNQVKFTLLGRLLHE